jgi:hypothetical protein
MRKCVQNLPSGKETKTDANNKIKKHARRQENERHPKNKTTKAENTKLYSLLIPLILVRVSRINA